MAFFRKIGEKLKNLFTTRKIDESFFEDLEDTRRLQAMICR